MNPDWEYSTYPQDNRNMSRTNSKAKDLEVELAKAVRWHREGHLQKAREIYCKILKQDPNHADALHLLGYFEHQTGNGKAALELISKAIEIQPQSPLYHHNLGLVCSALGQDDKAIASYQKALANHSDYYEAYYNLGTVFQNQNQLDQALYCYQKALAIQPELPEALASMGHALLDQGKFADAALSYQQALELRPQDTDLLHRLGRVMEELGKLDEALAWYRKILEIQPQHAEACNDMGVVFRQQGQYAEAMSCFLKAIEIENGCAEAHNNRGNLLQDSGNLEAAAESYRKALVIRPDFVQACNNLGMAYQGMGQSENAIARFQKAIKIQPDGALAHRHLVHQLQKDCAWEKMEAYAAKLDRLTKLSLDTGNCAAEDPFLNLTRHADPAYNFSIARAWSADLSRRMANVNRQFFFNECSRRSKPITIGYLSNNFHDHPMAHLLLGLFSLHNRNKFKINCYSCGRVDDSYYRRRISQDCDKFVDLRDLSHLEAAKAIYNDRVDILVDLMGHTKGSRMEICALRPAPIQVRYLGLAGTTGADFFDYILTDKIVTPEADAPYYSENFAYLPHCYQINDYKQTYGDDISAAGEPELLPNRFVFCSFNQDYKIEPVMFDCWMKILRRVPESILWLMVRHSAAKKHLRAEANDRGVNPDRLIFLEKRPKKQHLARLKMTDLALDTRVVNGAATTSDALWAGIPAITVRGKHFASRMSASILTAVGLPELIAHNIEEYEEIAVQTASDRDKLAELRQKLVRNRLTEPLFDTLRFVNNLEQAYDRMWQIFQAGSKARQFEVIESPFVDRHNFKPELNNCILTI